MSANSNLVTSKFKYNGKELNDEIGLDWYDFGARNYDASLGRWFSVDPYSEKFYSLSIYNSLANNPVFFVDPDGKEVINGETARRQRIENQVSAFENRFNQRYKGGVEMNRDDFGTKEEWKEYRDDRDKLSVARKKLKRSIKKEQKINEAIADFKKADPIGFYNANRLSYIDKGGKNQIYM